MYKVTEKKLDILLCECTNLADKLSTYRLVDKTQMQHFGSALLDVQTEVHRQQNVQDIGLGRQHLSA